MTEQDIQNIAFAVRIMFEDDEDELVFIQKFILEVDDKEMIKYLAEWIKRGCK